MTIPYYTPTTIDGETRRALVERVEACRPRRDVAGAECLLYVFANTAPAWYLDDCYQIGESPDIARRLTRLAVIEWVQNLRRDSACEREDFMEVLLRGGDRGYPPMSDAGYNELAHRLADALDFKH